MTSTPRHQIALDKQRASLACILIELDAPDRRRAMDKGGYHVEEETPAALMMRHGVPLERAAAVVRERIAADAEDVLRGERREWDFSSGYTHEGWAAAREALGPNATNADVCEHCVRLHFGLSPTPAPEVVAKTIARIRAFLAMTT